MHQTLFLYFVCLFRCECVNATVAGNYSEHLWVSVIHIQIERSKFNVCGKQLVVDVDVDVYDYWKWLFRLTYVCKFSDWFSCTLHKKCSGSILIALHVFMPYVYRTWDADHVSSDRCCCWFHYDFANFRSYFSTVILCQNVVSSRHCGC